ncbi:DUF1435 family protein, partial [Escherichia coli]
MLQRTLGSGWGVLLPGLLIAGLMYADLSPDQWRIKDNWCEGGDLNPHV